MKGDKTVRVIFAIRGGFMGMEYMRVRAYKNADNARVGIKKIRREYGNTIADMTIFTGVVMDEHGDYNSMRMYQAYKKYAYGGYGYNVDYFGE